MTSSLIVSPYLDHLGGGERYMLTIASVLESLGHQVTYAWDNGPQILDLAAMLGLSLHTPTLDPKIKSLYFGSNPLAMYLATRPYDLVIYLSDGSLPLLGGKKNILHMQVPFHQVGGKNWKNQLKKLSIHHVIVNSNFTKQIVDKEYGINSTVLYPPVTPITCTEPKENIILSVGRFEPSLNAKKHDVMIKAWREISPSLPNWKLVLVGGSSSDAHLAMLRKLGEGLPLDLVPNASHDSICSLYARAKIYWHAAGYGVDPAKNPELTEHFGISTVEAISARAIPLVLGVGGQTEIIKNPSLQWSTIEELGVKTRSLAKLSFDSFAAELDINPYSATTFQTQLKSLLT